MARVIEELYCQVDGKVYVSGDEISECTGCSLGNGKRPNRCTLENSVRYNRVCSGQKIIWKELEANE